MSGRVMRRLIEDERRGEYLGKTVQIIPHMTNLIQDYIEEAGSGFDVHIAEVGGTVGDYEGLAFIEAFREFATRVGAENCLYVHVVYVPYLGASKEFKSKPSQMAVRELRSLGISPDVLVIRSEEPTPDSIRDKLHMFTNVDKRGIISLPNAKSVYQVPLTIEKSGLADFITEKLSLKSKKTRNLANWESMVDTLVSEQKKTVRVGVVAKYMDNEDTYISVFEALAAAGVKHKVNVEIDWINAEELTARNASSKFKKVDGIVVPGGFGSRGVEGKITAATHAIKSNVPYLGLCLGMQVGVIAVARVLLGKNVNTTEIDETVDHPVIHIMEEQRSITNKGGTMRLGNYPCKLKPGTKARKLYGAESVQERHRHRYEFNNAYRMQLEESGLVVAGESPDGKLVELIELNDHPFFMASQFHPEYKSRPDRPHPMFDGFIAELKG